MNEAAGGATDGFVEGVVRDARLESLSEALGAHLRRGELALYLGAGVSIGLGFPSWEELTERIEAAVPGLKPKAGVQLGERLDAARRRIGDETKFRERVREALYGEWLDRRDEQDTVLDSSRLMRALGALIMGSSRGSASEVATLNFDDRLQTYLSLHGFTVQVVDALPTVLSAKADVRIYHLHGSLPLRDSGAAASPLVLTKSEFADRLANASGAWNTMLAHLIQSKVILYLGTSLQDDDVLPVLRRVLALQSGGLPKGYLPAVGLDTDDEARLRDYGVVGIDIGQYDDLPGFLLKVCQAAARKTR